MTSIVKVRQIIEFEVEVDDRKGWEFEVEDFNRKLAEGEITQYDAKGDAEVMVTEVISRTHQENYVFDVDMEAELYALLVDGEKVFEHRDHNEVVREYGRRKGVEVTFSKDPKVFNRSGAFLDYGDPDAAWDTIKGRSLR